MRLVEFDQVESIIVLQRIVSSIASGRRTRVMDFAVAYGDMAGPKSSVVPRAGASTGRIIRSNVIVRVVRFVDAVAVNAVATAIDLLACTVGVVRVWND